MFKITSQKGEVISEFRNLQVTFKSGVNLELEGEPQCALICEDIEYLTVTPIGKFTISYNLEECILKKSTLDMHGVDSTDFLEGKSKFRLDRVRFDIVSLNTKGILEGVGEFNIISSTEINQISEIYNFISQYQLSYSSRNYRETKDDSLTKKDNYNEEESSSSYSSSDSSYSLTDYSSHSTSDSSCHSSDYSCGGYSW
jgi:hypothetical protein